MPIQTSVTSRTTLSLDNNIMLMITTVKMISCLLCSRPRLVTVRKLIYLSNNFTKYCYPVFEHEKTEASDSLTWPRSESVSGKAIA